MTDGDQNKLGEVLRTAREARDVDLARVERDTKIRARYLQALEDGDYAELPGAVYTKGFLRNYGAYLGLDTEYLIDLYRLESSQPTTEKPTVPTPPRPISTRRSRPLIVTPGVIMAALLTVGVAIFIVYIAVELVTFARTPELDITDAGGRRAVIRPAGVHDHRQHRAELTGHGGQAAGEPHRHRRCQRRLHDRGWPGAGLERDQAGRQRPGDGPRQRSGDAHDRGWRRGLTVGGARGAGLHRAGGGGDGVRPGAGDRHGAAGQ